MAVPGSGSATWTDYSAEAAETDDGSGLLLDFSQVRVGRSGDERWLVVNAAPDAVGLSIAFSGRSRFGSAAADALAAEEKDHIYVGPQTGSRYFVVRASVATRPEIDLDELAERPDPAGLLASRLLWLERKPGDAERDALVKAAAQHLRDQAGKAVWNDLPADDLDAVAWLRQAGIRALDGLLAQTAAESVHDP